MHLSSKVALTVSAGMFVLMLLLLFPFNSASTPDEVAGKFKVRLPAYEIVDQDDNLDRTASCWDCYGFTIKFKESLSERFLKRLKKNRWCRLEDGVYVLMTPADRETWSGFIVFDPKENKAEMEYYSKNYWD